MSRRGLIATIGASLVWLPALAAQNDAEVRRGLVGTWVWASYTNGQQVYNELTLAGVGNGSGDFAYSQADQAGHLVTQTGKWGYSDGFIGFNTLWSNVKDPTGMYLVLGSIQVVEVGEDYVRTTEGLARRKR